MEKQNQKPSLQQAMEFVKSPAGQQLLAMLKQKDPETIRQATALAKAGNYQQALDTLNKGGSHGGSGK